MDHLDIDLDSIYTIDLDSIRGVRDPRFDPGKIWQYRFRKYGIPPFKCARILLVFSKWLSRLLYT